MDSSHECYQPSQDFPIYGPFSIILLIDPPVQALTEEQPKGEDEEEGEEGSSMAELAEQIDSHVKIINVENPTTNTTPRGQSAPKVNPVSTILTFGEVFFASPTMAQDPIS